jgi:LuxR family maltose regulon positive regulatory protein
VRAAEIKQLHQRAAAWYTQNGFTDEAIHHALAAEDAGQAAALIEGVGLNWIGQGQLSRLLGWLEKLPAHLVQTRPLLCLYHAWVLNLTGQTAALEARLQDTERVLFNAPPALVKDIRGQITTLRAYVARHQGRISLSIELLRQALVDCAPDNFFARTVINLNLGFNYWLTGQLTLADQPLQVARTDAQAIQAGYALLVAMAIQADLYVAQGKLRQAAQLYEEAIAYGLAHNGGRPFPPAGYAYAGLGGVLYEQNELAAAKDYLVQAIELGELLADGTIIRRGVFYLAPLRQMAGDSATVQVLWQQAQAATDTVEEKHVAVHQVRSWLAQAVWPPQAAELAPAVGWANAYRQSQPDPGSYQESFAQMTLAWVELAQGQTQQALARLDPLAIAATRGQSHRLIKILALQAMAHAAQGEAEAALAALNRALDLAAPEGYVRTFIDHGRPMQQLLQQAAMRAIAPDYVSRLLAAFPDLPHLGRRDGQVLATDDLREDSQIVNPKSDSANLVEPLTDHELAILRLMAAGLSNQEIADQLYLSLNTIKWYARHIFSKLAVNKRTQAVARAQELGIL